MTQDITQSSSPANSREDLDDDMEDLTDCEESELYFDIQSQGK